jgi:hypothetical protein
MQETDAERLLQASVKGLQVREKAVRVPAENHPGPGDGIVKPGGGP